MVRGWGHRRATRRPITAQARGGSARAVRAAMLASSFREKRMSRPPTNLPVSRAAALDQHKHRHLHALRAVSSAQKQQCGK